MAVRPGAGKPMAPGTGRPTAPSRTRKAPQSPFRPGSRPSVVGVTKKTAKKKKTGFQQVLSSLRTNAGSQSRMSRFG